MNKPVFKENNIPMKTGLFIIYEILAYKNLVFAVNLRNTNNSEFRIPNSEFIIAPGGERRPGFIPARERVFRGERILLSIDRQYG